MATKKKSKKKPKAYRKVLKWLVIGGIAVFAYLVYILFAPNIFPKTEEKGYLCIPDSSTFNDVLDLLEKDANVFNFYSFKQASTLLQYGTKIRPGRY